MHLVVEKKYEKADKGLIRIHFAPVQRGVQSATMLFWFPVLLTSQSLSRKLLLHIGPHKTGSTSFQTFIKDRQKQLAASNVLLIQTPLMQHRHVEAGFVAPWAMALQRGWYPGGPRGRITKPMGGWYASKNITDEDLMHEHEAVLATLRSSYPHDVVMSCEELSLLTDRDAWALRNALLDFDVTVVAVYRDLLSRTISLARHLFKHQLLPKINLDWVVGTAKKGRQLYPQMRSAFPDMRLVPIWGPWREGWTLGHALLNVSFGNVLQGSNQSSSEVIANVGSFHTTENCSMLSELMPLAIAEYWESVNKVDASHPILPPQGFFDTMTHHLPFCFDK